MNRGFTFFFRGAFRVHASFANLNRGDPGWVARVHRLKGVKIAKAKQRLQRFRVPLAEPEIPTQLGARRAINSPECRRLGLELRTFDHVTRIAFSCETRIA